MVAASAPRYGSVSIGSGSTSWSPDGRFIAVVGIGINKLQVCSFSGSGNPILVGSATNGLNQPNSVSWSPDGRFLAVVNIGSNFLQIFSLVDLAT